MKAENWAFMIFYFNYRIVSNRKLFKAISPHNIMVKNIEAKQEGYSVEQIKSAFANNVRSSIKRGVHRPEYERAEIGIRNFKRKIMGFCGRSAVKSKGELVAILEGMQVVHSNEEAEKLITGLKRIGEIDYGVTGFHYLTFEQIKDERGNEVYIIEKRAAPPRSSYDDHL